MSFNLDSPEDILHGLRDRARGLRLAKNLSQEGLALRSGLSLSSLKRFERTGRISLESLLNLAMVLDSLEDFKSVFQANSIKSLDEIIQEKPKRKRGRRK